MNKYSISTKILHRIKLLVNQTNDSWEKYVNIKASRDCANRLRGKIIRKNGRQVVDRRLKKKIKEYCREAFGDTSYWPWLAYYTELRGEFKEGWIPDDYYRFELIPKMNPEKYMRFSEAKTIDHKLFNGRMIEPLFFRSNGQYCGKDGSIKTKPDIEQILGNLKSEVIIKPDNGCGGQRIMFENSTGLCLDELPADIDLLFQQVVQQHPELHKLYPHSINTFRVLTFIDQKGDIKIKFIIIRFGRGGTRVDNASSGGGWTFVHLDGKVESTAYDINGIELGDRHPDTGIKYADLELPFLSKIITLCKNAHRTFPYTRIIGWDVFVNEKKEPKLIEWNANNPAFWPIEMRFGPFFDKVVNE
jgi:hypothetical protein